MKRARLTLGERQSVDLLLALSYAIDTYMSDDELDDAKFGASSRRQIAQWERLRSMIRDARLEAKRRG